MIPPDQEIFAVEQRIASRRAQLKHHARVGRERAMQKLASPAALVTAAGLGFLLAYKFAHRKKEPPHPERRKSDHAKAAKATGLAGILTTALMWYVRAQYGSPVAAAHALLEKFQGRKQSTSVGSDMTPTARDVRVSTRTKNVTPLRRSQA